MIRSTVSILAIWCATGSLAWAVSIYDVIQLTRQGYSDEQIVDIIRTTHSVFKLTAEDIPRLKSLGVNEEILRTMMSSMPAELAEIELRANDSLEREISPSTNSNIASYPPGELIGKSTSTIAGSDFSTNSGNSGSVSSPAISPDRFSVKTVSGDAGEDHQHAYMTLNSVPIFILGDEGRFRSVEDRGRAVGLNLEEAVRMGEGRFRMLRANGTYSLVYHSIDLRELPIITVSRHDVDAYDASSERRVTAELLASYWAALLNDYWAIAFQHRAPSRLVKLQQGDALMLLFEAVDRTKPDGPQNLGKAAQRLPGTIQSHLEHLATMVPVDFDTWPGYPGDTS